jgi:septum formation protein
MKTIVLASGSPRRKEILEKTGLPFVVDPSNFEEDLKQDLEPKELAKALSLGKAKDVAKRHKNAIVIGADSITLLNGKVLGKPHTIEKAIKMLLDLSGSTHSAITGYTIIDTESGKIFSDAVETKIYFRDLSKEEIEKYVATGEPLDKAGAYAIQGKGKKLVEKIEGDYYNVMGLPLSSLVKNLKKFGIKTI